MGILSYILALIRAFLLLFGMTVGLIVFYIGLPVVSDQLKWGFKIRDRWIRWAIGVLNIHLQVRGPIPEGMGLVVCNHLSMMDPVLLLHLVSHAHPLSKAELANYPIIGQGARATGVLFVHRKDEESRAKVKETIRRELAKGTCILVFPEGTVGPGDRLLPFKSGSFHIAAATDRAVHPACIRYASKKDIWQGDDGLWTHFRTQFGQWKTEVDVTFGPSLKDDSGEQLRRDAFDYIRSELTRPISIKPSE